MNWKEFNDLLWDSGAIIGVYMLIAAVVGGAITYGIYKIVGAI